MAKYIHVLSYTYNCFYRLKPANFDCDWNSEDDSRLLKGIYQHGMGSWEAIKMDNSLKLGDKIFPNGSKLHLKKVNARAEYLLKVLKKQMDSKLGVVRNYCFIFIVFPRKIPLHLYFILTGLCVYPSIRVSVKGNF